MVFNKKEQLIILGSGLLVAATMSAMLLVFVFAGPMLSAAPGKPGKAPALYSHGLDGTATANPADTSPLVIGVMIDNHPDARPQLGLAAARVVYEAPVEGGVTRFLALYAASDAVTPVGPVRSARPYFVDWLREYGNALYLHSGGSPAALKELKAETQVFDVNEFWRGRYFWRDQKFWPPHNLFTGSAAWQQLAADTAAERPSSTPWQPWKFGAVSNSATNSYSTREFTIPFAPEHQVRWRYREEAHHYERFVNDVAARDQSGAFLAARTVVVQYTTMETSDEEGRREIATVGSGSATLFHDGLKLSGRWSKAAGSRTRFYTESGEEIIFTPGPIWIEVVSLGTRLTVTN